MSKTKKIIVKLKKRRENKERWVWTDSNPHSKKVLFSKSTNFI